MNSQYQCSVPLGTARYLSAAFSTMLGTETRYCSVPLDIGRYWSVPLHNARYHARNLSVPIYENVFVAEILKIMKVSRNFLRAKGDCKIPTRRASEGAGRIIHRIAASIWAKAFEEPRILCRRTASHLIATILISLEHVASALASSGGFQLRRALLGQVVRARYRATICGSGRGNGDGEIESVDERVFDDGGGGGWVGGAVESARAVTGEAGAFAGGIEGAVGASPDGAEGGAGGVGGKGPVLGRGEVEAAAVGDGAGPDGMGAVVGYEKGGGLGEGEEEEEEEGEGEEGWRSHCEIEEDQFEA
ncbi:hypothetical protein IEQ34_013560 [Dendrobium chrysotoxum]|uniref:Uncharacterized protein n=1 Tax=Dendrobium chrysotoxum TaxID=161865 RepID=A0AAV7GPS5_DENCH|nr:hypothetical protein IEQ34_013560 [Dendrobium chrysotoxum]